MRTRSGWPLALIALALPPRSAQADLGNEIVLAPRQSADPSPFARPLAVALAGSTRLVVWTRWEWVPAPTTSQALMATRVDSSGNVLDPIGIQLASVSDAEPDVVVSTDGVGFLVGWTVPSAHLVLARRLAADGTFPDGNAIVSVTGARAAQGWDGTRYRLLVSTSAELVDLRIASNGAVSSTSSPLGLSSVVAGSIGTPSLVAHSDGTALWALRIDDAGLALDPLPGILVTDPTPPVSRVASVPVNGGHVLTWKAEGFVLPGAGGAGGSGPGAGGAGGSAPLGGAGGTFGGAGGSAANGGSGGASSIPPLNSGGTPGTYLREFGVAHVASSGDATSYPLGNVDPYTTSLTTRGTEAALLVCTPSGSTGVRMPASGGPPQVVSSLLEPSSPCAIGGDAAGYLAVSWTPETQYRSVLYHLDPMFARDAADVVAMRRTSAQTGVAAASNGDGYLVAWRDNALSHLCPYDPLLPRTVLAARLDRCGNVLDARPFAVSHRDGWDARNLAAAFGNGVYVVTWQAFRSDANGEVVRDRVARITPEGQVLDPNGIDLGPTISQGMPSLASDGNAFVMAGSAGVVRVRRFDAAGNVEPDPLTLPGPSWHPSIAFDGASYVVSFDRPAVGNARIQVARLSPSGVLLDPTPITIAEGDWLVNGPSASNGARTLVTWTSAPPGLGGPIPWQGHLVEKDGQPTPGASWQLGHAGYQRASLVYAGSFVWQPSLQVLQSLVYDGVVVGTLDTELRRYADDGTPLDTAPTTLPQLWTGSPTALAAGAGSALLAYAPMLGEPDDAHRARARLVTWGAAPTCPADAGVPLAPDFELPSGPVDCDAGSTTGDAGVEAGLDGAASADASDAGEDDASTGGTSGAGSAPASGGSEEPPGLTARGGCACHFARAEHAPVRLMLLGWGLLALGLARARARQRRGVR